MIRDAEDAYRSTISDIRRTGTFTVTADHLKLLRAAYVDWDACEFGAPAIDSKRPYGNGGVVRDIANIVEPGWASAFPDGRTTTPRESTWTRTTTG